MESTKDIILACIKLVPIPVLNHVFDIFRKIWGTVKAVQTMRGQLFTLSGALAHLLQTLDREHRFGRLDFGNTAREIVELDRFVNSCSIQYQWVLTRVAGRSVC